MHLHSLAAHTLSLHMQQLLNIFYRKNRKLIQSSGIDWKRDWWFRTVSFSFTSFYWWWHICKCSENTCLDSESCPEEMSLKPPYFFFFFFLMLKRKKIEAVLEFEPHQFTPEVIFLTRFSFFLPSFFFFLVFLIYWFYYFWSIFGL